MERFVPKIQPERFLDRLERKTQVAPPPLEKPVALPDPLTLLSELEERIAADLGQKAALLTPMLQELRKQLATIFLPEISQALDEKQHAACIAEIERLSGKLEDVLFAMSLSTR